MADASGDVSFEEFVAARGQALLRSAYLLTGDLHAAEDLLQSALERCAGRWTRLTTQPEAYVRRVMYNENVSIWRRRKVRPECLVSELPDVVTGEHDDATIAALLLQRGLTRLTARQRTVLVLRYYEDLSEAQIAEAMGCSLGTVKSQASYALRRLRELAPELADLRMTTEGAR